jgi:hypothetical protein
MALLAAKGLGKQIGSSVAGPQVQATDVKPSLIACEEA